METEDMRAMLNAPLATLAVLIGETNTALVHADVTGVGLEHPFEVAHLEDVLTSATAAWAVRWFEVGAITVGQACDLDAMVADAREWLTANPAALAAHDEQFAAYKNLIGNEGG